jgi:hypothetical protein
VSDPEAAAKWMAEVLEREKTLYQDVAVAHVAEVFGDALVTTNANGNMALDRPVLQAFNKLTPGAVWVRSGRFWRQREEFDLPGRQQP